MTSWTLQHHPSPKILPHAPCISINEFHFHSEFTIKSAIHSCVATVIPQKRSVVPWRKYLSIFYFQYLIFNFQYLIFNFQCRGLATAIPQKRSVWLHWGKYSPPLSAKRVCHPHKWTHNRTLFSVQEISFCSCGNIFQNYFGRFAMLWIPERFSSLVQECFGQSSWLCNVQYGKRCRYQNWACLEIGLDQTWNAAANDE